MSRLAPAYAPRRPIETVLYALVHEHLETFLAHARETYGAPLPRYVQDELRGYLRCGVFAYGFVRCRCDACGRDLLLAFSCKGRGVCPSCGGRRMANTAAHLVDRVLPAVPVRQWVLSLPFELRALAAFNADVLATLSRLFVEAIFARQRAHAKRAGIDGAQSGAVTFVQRFGSSLNLNVHFHVVVLDGVFARDAEGRAVFHASATPTRGDLDAVVRRAHGQAVRWLARRGYIKDTPLEARSNEPAAESAIERCAALAMQRGDVRAIGESAESARRVAITLDAIPPPNEDAVAHEGFNLHASVAIAADDDLGRERLCRYGARPPFSLERMRRLPDGRIAYRIKKLRGGREKLRIMTPLELLARVAALVPPPRYPLIRYHGVLAPRSAWRREIVPKPRGSPACSGAPSAARAESVASGASSPPREIESRDEQVAQSAPSRPKPARSAGASIEASVLAPCPSAPQVEAATPASSARPLAPNIISTQHWDRLMNGALFATSPRVDWATLLRRTFEVDVLECAECHGRLRVLGAVTEPAAARTILERLGMPAEAPKAFSPKARSCLSPFPTRRRASRPPCPCRRLRKRRVRATRRFDVSAPSRRKTQSPSDAWSR